jgi:hypothetical protein
VGPLAAGRLEVGSQPARCTQRRHAWVDAFGCWRSLTLWGIWQIAPLTLFWERAGSRAGLDAAACGGTRSLPSECSGALGYRLSSETFDLNDSAESGSRRWRSQHRSLARRFETPRVRLRTQRRSGQ